MYLNKRILLLIAFVTLIASCSSDEAQPDPYTIKMDSASNARIMAKENELAHKNDSILRALEIHKADSIEQEIEKESANRPKHAPKDTVKHFHYIPAKSTEKDSSKN